MLLLKGTRSLEFVPVSVVPVAAVPGRMCCGPERQEIICCVRHSWSSTLAQECDCQVVLTHGSISQDTFHCSDVLRSDTTVLLFFFSRSVPPPRLLTHPLQPPSPTLLPREIRHWKTFLFPQSARAEAVYLVWARPASVGEEFARRLSLTSDALLSV